MPQHGGAVAGASLPTQLWLAMGVIVTKHAPPFRRQTSGLNSVAWRYVSTRPEHEGDSRYLVVPCQDFFYANVSKVAKTTMGFQFSCFCKTVHWFQRGLTLYPTVRFLGKMEDDSVLYDARVVAELMNAYRLARRSRPRETALQPAKPMLWYAHFDWALHLSGDLTRAKFCAVGDNVMLQPYPWCGHKGAGVLAPFANGGLDIRSRALAEQAAACGPVWDYIRDFNRSNASYGASCDGMQGFFMARCLADGLSAALEGVERREADGGGSGGGTGGDTGKHAIKAALAQRSSLRPGVMTALHLPWPKFHPPSRGIGARMHSSLIHPDKRCMNRASWFRKATDAAAACGPMVTGWKWNYGSALLPFPFRVDVGKRADGSGMLSWHAFNRSMVARYNQLHVKREDERYCSELPCGGIAPNRTRRGASAAVSRAATER